MQKRRLRPPVSIVLLVLLATLIVLAGHAQNPSSTGTLYSVGQKNDNRNLYREIMQHQDQVPWQFSERDVLPSDLCRVLVGTCPVKNLPFKIFGFPLESPAGTDPGTLVLSWTADQSHPDMVMLANATRDKASFFLLSPEGRLLRAASRTKSGSWLPVANEAVYNQFEVATTLWHQWFASLRP